MNPTPFQVFLDNVIARTQRDGWIEFVLPLIQPLIEALIKRCTDSGASLQLAASNLTRMQRAAIVSMARQATIEGGIPVFRGRLRATLALAQAIEEELRDVASRDFGPDVWQAAYNEATCYVFD